MCATSISVHEFILFHIFRVVNQPLEILMVDSFMEYVFTDLGFDSDIDFSGDLWEIDFTDIESAELSSSSAEDCSESSSGLEFITDL